MTFKEFIDSNMVNAWVYEKYIKIYVRKSYRAFDSKRLVPCFDIGSVEVQPRHKGHGIFTAFLTRFEQVAQKHGRGVFVESVLEPRFQDFFKRRGYQMDPRVADTPAPSFFKL